MLELPILPLALAFIVVGVAAWLLGRRSAGARTVRLPRDYYVGLDHLINDRFDRATEVFARMAQVDGDAAEIQFALGSLFRKRGEVERAIAIHSRLREQGAPELRDRAAFALALDYLSAGLMDRAERLLEELAATGAYRNVALERLVGVYEQQGDWASALRVFHQLPPALQKERRRAAAHYLCELAEEALVQGDEERAGTLLRQARTHDPDLPRAELLNARLLEKHDPHAALERYIGAVEAAPGLALEVIPRVLALASSIGERGAISELAARLRGTGRFSSRQIAWLLATALPSDATGELADAVTELLAECGPTNGALTIGTLLTRIGDAGGRYQCEQCGLHSVGWFWRCPKCRTWDCLRPVVFSWSERAEETARA
ncbi:MAG: hypothetical protein DIU56_001495 [Pseudomonadota bacterium]|nr:MAG: hypothetical protein DIU56_04210 [Pseudomonadota bacterium]